MNNAGSWLAPFAGLGATEQLAIVELNVRTLVEMTPRFLPGIVTVSALCPSYTEKISRPARDSGRTQTSLVSRLSTSTEVAEAGCAGLIAQRREIVPGSLNKLCIGLLPFFPKSITLAVISQLQQNRAFGR